MAKKTLKEEKNTVDIEELLKKLDKITSEMESEKCTLEKSFELYKEGLAATKEAKEIIDQIEGKIKILESENQ